jgi:hypothetical protein
MDFVILISCIGVENLVSVIKGLTYWEADSGLIFVIIAHMKGA